MKGILKSEKTKENISNSMKGRICKPFSNKHKKNMSDARKGEKHPMWKGGISFLPYCIKFNKLLKEKIRDRDNRTCQLCWKTEEDEGKKLSIHHIHYDKENCYPDLISLCRSCNAKVNSNRDYWEDFFMKILKYRDLLN